MQFSADLLIGWIGTYLWAFTRVGSMLMVMVAIGSRMTPIKIRLYYALAVTVVSMPMIPPMTHQIELFSITSAIVIIQQMLIGTAIGMLSIFVVQTFVIAGQVIAMQTSLGFASMADPMNGQSTPVVGQLYILFATLLFFGINGHLLMIQVIVRSFETLPISSAGLTALDYHKLAGWLSLIIKSALAFSITSTVAMLLVNLSFGIMTKVSPQLNIFSLGFSISMVFGLYVLWITLINVPLHFENQWLKSVALMCELLNGACGIR
ncbi:MAG: flagellar type III secretion system protein FliR [Psychromonas sp.]|nr:flagellar type III secretion system protein FliR [Psychromonas sp.]